MEAIDIEKDLANDKKRRLKEARYVHKQARSRYYNLNSIMGIPSIFKIIIGPRKTGKSYAVMDMMLRKHTKHPNDTKIYWMRISETSTKAMLANKANKLIDPDLYRKYNCDITTKGSTVFNHGKVLMEVLPLSGFAKLKGTAFYDKDFLFNHPKHGHYYLILDEFILEQGEKSTSFDTLYAFQQMCENIARTTKDKITVILLANNVQEAEGIMRSFDFVPLHTGRFKLRSKSCVIDVLPATEEYLEDRKGSIAQILGGGDGNYSTDYVRDMSLIYKGPIYKPTTIIKFSKNSNNWYTVYDGKIIRKYNKEKIHNVIAMRPYIDERYNKELVLSIFELYDAQTLQFANLSTQSYFKNDLQKLRKNR
ncbi:MAG: phage DNA encapsidation protein [archaeon]|nr:phage DNA encapsidation protein [archaeon]